MKKTLLFFATITFSFLAQAQFGPQQLISENVGSDIFPCDIDNDADTDLVAANNGDDTISWYENIDGLGNFGTQQIISTQADQAQAVHAADLDGDGDMDVVSGSQADSKIAWYANDGQGNFGAEQIISTIASSVHDVYATDIDGDGDMDILAAIFGGQTVAWYENMNGQGNFGTANLISISEVTPYAVYSADLDSDGDTDVLCAAWQGNRITWFENLDGLGNFGTARVISINARATESVFAEDIDADGYLDVLFTSSVDSKVAWHRNLDGLGNFGPEQIISQNATLASCVYAADLDNNGSIDALSASQDGKIAWYKNTDGLGTFGPEEILTTTNASGSVFGADIDGDGDNDVVSGGADIIWFENRHPLSVNENIIYGVSVYPNPVRNTLYIEVQNNSTIKSIAVFSVLGKKLIAENEPAPEVDFSGLPKGIYFLKVKTQDGIFSEKILKE